MKKVFISGSISIKELPNCVKNALDKMIEKKLEILVGDAFGIDSAVQSYFCRKNYFNLTIYTIEDEPRNCISYDFKIKKAEPQKDGIQVEYAEKEHKKPKKESERERQSVKDKKMVDDCDFALVIWDGKSKGSFNNMMNLIKEKKKFKLCFENKFYESPKESFLREIFKQNNGYGLRELRKELEKRELYFSSENKMKEFLHDKKILINNAPSPKFKEFFIEKFNKKYNKTSYAYSEELVDMIEKMYNEMQLL